MEKTGTWYKNKLKGRGIELKTVAATLEMTRQNLGYHFRKDNIDLNFKEKLLANYPDVFTDDSEDTVKGKIGFQTMKDPGVGYEDEVIDTTNRQTINVYTDAHEKAPAFTVNIPQLLNCDFGKLYNGKSMWPTIEHGSYVFLNRIDDRSVLLFGEIHYIEAGNYKFVRRLQASTEPGFVLACADNDELRPDGRRRYEDVRLRVSQIKSIYLVRGYLMISQN